MVRMVIMYEPLAPDQALYGWLVDLHIRKTNIPYIVYDAYYLLTNYGIIIKSSTKQKGNKDWNNIQNLFNHSKNPSLSKSNFVS